MMLMGSSPFSSSFKVLLFMIPLAVLFGFVSVMGPRASTSPVILSNHPWLWSSFSSSSSSPNNNQLKIDMVASKAKAVDLHSTVVMAGVEDQKEGLLSDPLNLNHSSSTPTAVQPAVQVQDQSVSFFFLIVFFSKIFFFQIFIYQNGIYTDINQEHKQILTPVINK